MSSVVGVVAIQGDFEKHIQSLRMAGADEVVEVRTPEELESVGRLVIPGGESTAVGKLMERFGLGAAIQRRAAQGMPVWGTCMGMILMANEIEERHQYTLDLLQVTVRRNAFGPQVHSFEDTVTFKDVSEPILAVFIRAPVVVRTSPQTEILATYNDEIVAVREGRCVGTSFHPELTDDIRLHEWFLKL